MASGLRVDATKRNIGQEARTNEGLSASDRDGTAFGYLSTLPFDRLQMVK